MKDAQVNKLPAKKSQFAVKHSSGNTEKQKHLLDCGSWLAATTQRCRQAATVANYVVRRRAGSSVSMSRFGGITNWMCIALS